jgi:hypothetical protein
MTVKQTRQWPFAMRHLCKYTSVLELLLGSGPHATIEALLEAVFSIFIFYHFCGKVTKMKAGHAVAQAVSRWLPTAEA